MNEMLKLMQSLSANSGGLGGAGAAPGVASHMPSSMHPSNNAWSRGFKSQDEMYEWLVDCYRMRLDDDYAWGGCFLHGLYDQENTKQDIVADFLVFAKLAVRHDCLPSTGWNWERFLQKAKSLIPYAFEKSDAKEKYGGENVFSAFTGGRSLRSTGEIIFNSSVTSHGMSEIHARVDKEVEKVYQARNPYVSKNEALFAEVGGMEVWKKFQNELVLVDR